MVTHWGNFLSHCNSKLMPQITRLAVEHNEDNRCCNVFYYSHSTLLLPNAHRNWYGPLTPVSKLSAQQIRAGTWYRTMVNLWHTDRRSKSYVCIFFGRAYISGIRAADHTVYGYGRTLYGLYTAISVPSSVPYASTSVTLMVQYVV